ncbi:hypothetical protein [Alteribacter natronophilus]|uniref:hypothetical protein n=1 Tax=Alteribacter natronophilus TaxID=2583810 RepID=UPI00110ECAFC|nr:hypothetical protein [Alteribacter natronophilus]TMW72833.1 hypothetical protein FGB90_00530 [Alteribacter natronophilus]
MERLIVKTGVYSFAVSFLVLLAFTDRYVTSQSGDVIQTSARSYPDYFFGIVQISAQFTLAAIIAVIVIGLIRKYKN